MHPTLSFNTSTFYAYLLVTFLSYHLAGIYTPKSTPNAPSFCAIGLTYHVYAIPDTPPAQYPTSSARIAAITIGSFDVKFQTLRLYPSFLQNI